MINRGVNNMNGKKVARESLGKKIRGHFLAGLLVVVPVGASIWFLIWLFLKIDNILQPVIKAILGDNLPGVGFVVTILLIYVIGVIAKNVIGKRIINFGNTLLDRVPIFRQLSSGIRQILESFTTPDKTGFMQVVMVEFPKDGTWTIGFITNETVQQNGEKLVNVLIPTSPTPWSGFLQILKEKDIIRTSISVEEAIKMIVSCGRTMPEEIQAKIHTK
jgi:uncharacterized membrane protein